MLDLLSVIVAILACVIAYVLNSWRQQRRVAAQKALEKANEAKAAANVQLAAHHLQRTLLRAEIMRHTGDHESHAEDIGMFGHHTNSIGIELLQNHSQVIHSNKRTVREICRSLNATTTTTGSRTSIVTHPQKYTFLNETQCATLIQDVEDAFAKDGHALRDFKHYLTLSRLGTLIGLETVACLVQCMSNTQNKIIIRRCSEHGKCIQFHTDHSLKTLQIPLNDEDEYKGGRLVYCVEDELFFPARPSGSATMHGNTVAHGVTVLEDGIRYGLFFLEEEDEKSQIKKA